MSVSQPSKAQQLATHGVRALRDRLRTLAAAGDVHRVEMIYRLLEQGWWEAANPDEHPYVPLCREPALFDGAVVPRQERVAFLQAWVQAYPDSYHAHLMSGACAHIRARQFRGRGFAKEVSAVQWLAATVAAEHAVVHFCEAMRCNPRAAMVYLHMYELSARFTEPGWLVALFAGRSDPDARPEGTEEEWQEAVGTHLMPSGLMPLDDVPAALPPGLPLRAEHDAKDGRLYWVQQATRARPDWLEILTTYAFYRTPRWSGGSHEEIEQFAHGPLCAGLGEPARNAVRWVGAHDYFSAFHEWTLPPPGAESQLRRWQAEFQPWLTMPLPPAQRRSVLELWAHFHGYSLDQPAKAVEIYAQAFAQTPAQIAFESDSWNGHDFLYQCLLHRLAGPPELMRTLFEQAVANNDYAGLLGWAAVAYRFGMWGVAADPARAEVILAACAVRTAEELYGLQTDTLETLLWESGYHEQALYLARGLAERDCATSCACLYNLLREREPDEEPVLSAAVVPFYKPHPHRNQQEAMRWLQRGAELGAPNAEYSFAHQMTVQPAYDLRRPEHYERCKELFFSAARKGLGMGGVRGARVMIAHGGHDEQLDAVNKVLRPYALDDELDAYDRACAMYDLAKAYRDGSSVPQSQHVAKAWITRARELAPDDHWIIKLHAELHGGGSLLGSLRNALRHNRLAPEHYPPGMHD
ncbi:Sel1 repeat-containing protein [Andreprevotia lacus DSM 23236]|jgi:TPR repeat protein|uniref:Sel1 repeat-containing protein n=1 Tax=Andreprevotia lacus DSM 23236 TaxID=1121001 RepID=A0A1W1XC24_9NEIS|nr:DUF4034 domain-containing protein [Andreprevotia lacus]SMC21419.1 Sel1 repeat-containing protein [Andreprevotia lacus DSM 23236]